MEMWGHSPKTTSGNQNVEGARDGLGDLCLWSSKW
jgi:hypothetical protein